MREEKENRFTSEVRLELLKTVLETGKPFRFIASGFSMYPFIQDKDIITIAPLPANRPLSGDVVAFILPDTGKLTVHRVTKIRDTIFQIRGDYMQEPDGLVPRINILGTVTRVERNGRNITTGLGRERRLIAFLSRHDLLRKISRVISLANRIGFVAKRYRTWPDIPGETPGHGPKNH